MNNLSRKQLWFSFLKDEHEMKNRPLELVHIDVIITAKVSSLGVQDILLPSFINELGKFGYIQWI